MLTDRLTTYPICALEVDKKAKVDGENTTPITPSQFEQFASAVRQDADRAEQGATASAASASASAQSASESASSATASEQSASQASGYAQNASESAVSAENAKDDAEDARDEIRAMRAEAVTLPAGSEATASYADGLLSLGIPRGNKGDTGDRGDTGATPNLTIGTVETLEPTEDATATITGTAENPVINLGIPQGEQGEVSLNQLYSILPTDEASGSIASFSDGADNVPMEHLKVTLEPIQSGSGTPSPDNIRPISGRTEVVTQRTGKNLLDATGILPISITRTNYAQIPIDAKVYEQARTEGISFKLLGNLGAGKTEFALYIYDTINNNALYVGGNQSLTASNGFSLSGLVTTTSGQAMDTTKPLALRIYAKPYSGDAISQIDGVCISFDTTDTEYHAYEGSTYTTDLGRTVYGGTLDVVSGELVVTHGYADLGTLSWSYSSTSGQEFFYHMGFDAKAKSGSEVLISAVCDSYSQVGYNAVNGNNGTFGTSQSGTYLKICDTNYSSSADFKTAMSGHYLCYELATPQTYQLTPQEVKTLLGNNNVWSDGDVEVTYKADVKLYIEKRLNGNTTTANKTSLMTKLGDSDITDSEPVELSLD
ncbi:MAG: hypothetical protein U0K87_05915 [Ruminococcus sp.]|nr:hypothetical protein [Ruminococcus sp.]